MNSMQRVCCLVMAVTLCAGGLLLFGLWSRTRELRSDEARVQAEFTANQGLATALRKRRSAPHQAGLQPVNAQQKSPIVSPSPAAPANASPGATNMDRGRQIRQALLRMPEYAPLLRAELRRRMMRNYGEWLSQLDVSNERLESIKELLAASIATKQDSFEALLDAGYRMGTLEFEKTWRNYHEDADTRLRQGFTPQEYASYQNFEAAKSWTNTELPQLEAYFGERGISALTPQQKRALREAYVAARNWQPTGEKPAPAVLHRMQNERIGVLAGSALEPVQREALVGYLTFINARNQVMGQLLNPLYPDAVVITPGVAPR